MSEEKQTITNRDPKAGCIIMIVGLAIFGGLIAYTLTLPFKQSGLMQGFTQPQQMELSTKEALPSPPAPLLKKMEGIQAQLETEQPVQLTLSLNELNDAIRSYVEFEELQGTMEIAEITKEEMRIKISFPLRGRPFSEETPHLNGMMHAVPAVMNDEIVLNVSKIEVVEGEVPDGFLSHFKPYRVMAKYSEHEHLGRAMFACEELKLQEGGISLRINPEKYADPKALENTEPDMEKKKKRTTVMTLCSFLMVGGLFIMLIRRRNARSAKAIKEME